jgi:hypothetical protein
MLAVPPPAALPAARVRIEPGRDDEVAIGLLAPRRRDGDRRRGRAPFVALPPRFLAPLPPRFLAPARAVLLVRARLLTGLCPPHRVLATGLRPPHRVLLTGLCPPHRVLALEDHAGADGDSQPQPEDRGDRRAGELVQPQELAEHRAHNDADRPAHDHGPPQGLAIALGGPAPATTAGALEHLLAALGGTGHGDTLSLRRSPGNCGQLRDGG